MNPAVVLVSPRIAGNVGAIGRVCAACRADLHIVRPVPFDLSDRSLKRAGMDYLEFLSLRDHHSWEECHAALQPRRTWFLTTRATRSIYDTPLLPDDALVFGSEESGLPESLHALAGDRALRIPMREPRARCLNLATAAAIALFELVRQATPR